MVERIVRVCCAWSFALCVACSGGASETGNDAGASTTADGAADSPVDGAAQGAHDGAAESAADSGQSDGPGVGKDSSGEDAPGEDAPGDGAGSTCSAGTVACAPAGIGGGPALVCTDSCPAACDSSQGLMMCCMNNGFGQCSCFCSDGCGGPSCAPAGTPVGTHHCASPADCACNEGCGTDGVCLAVGFTCSTDADCKTVSSGCPGSGAGYTCHGSRCVPPGWTCTNDVDCGAGHTCSAGTCK